MITFFQPEDEDNSDSSDIDEDLTDIITELIRYKVLDSNV